MYRDCSDPWLQDSGPSEEEDIALHLLERYSYRRVLDLGCGKGRFSGRLQRATQAPVIALDIAPTAVQTARLHHPEISFLAASAASLPLSDAQFDLVVSSQLLWYVIPTLPQVFAEVRRALRPGGHYLILQTYYAPGKQQYAKEVMTGPDDLLRILPFRPLHRVEKNRHGDPRFIALTERVP
jgi:ubiquinone/menaquinone biosynthesis C-methylase UbiE